MSKALDEQVGGSHYKELAFQPIEYIMANDLGWCEGNVVKLITRWKDKGGVQDLDKAIHYLQILKESYKETVNTEEWASESTSSV